ncbi:hypothetical protein AHAS_Ahas13G0312300 [Arachis hypogaea]
MAQKRGESFSQKRKGKAPQTGTFDTNRFNSKLHKEHFFVITSKKKLILKVKVNEKNYRTYVRGKVLDFSPRSIKETFQLPPLNPHVHDYSERMNRDRRYDQVLADICLSGAQLRMGVDGHLN